MWAIHQIFACFIIILRLIRDNIFVNFFNKLFVVVFLIFFFGFNLIFGIVLVSEEFLVGCSLLLFFFVVFWFVSILFVQYTESYIQSLRLKFMDLAYLNLSKLLMLRRYYAVDVINWSALFEFLSMRLQSEVKSVSKAFEIKLYTEFHQYVRLLLDKCVSFFFNVVLMPLLRFKFFLFSYNCKLSVCLYGVNRKGKNFDLDRLLRLHIMLR